MVLKSMLCAAASTAVLASFSPVSNATRVAADAFATAISVTEISMISAGGDASVSPSLPQAWVDEGVRWRSIGPANMGGRITDLAVNESDPSNFWVATASGGLLKTTNNGATFEHQFDDETTVSIGALALAQSNPDVLYIGTGEANPRNSVSWGDGVYKSTDGGDTWTHMGLSESFQTGGLVVHPEDPDVVYVGALGRLWGPNDQRGLFKSVDGGENWDKVLYIDDMTGIIDVKMNPADPDTLLVATYERQRDGFDTNDPAKKWGEGSALYKTVDGGETWQKISAGLPSCTLGRIGIDYYQNDPDTVYMVLESERIGQESPDLAYMGIRGEDADVGARITEVTEGGPAEAAGIEAGDIIIAFDAETVQSYDAMVEEIRQYKAGDKIVVEVSRDRESVLLDLEFSKRPDADEDEPGTPFGAMLGGQRENVQKRQGDEGNEFGGIYKSTDGGDSWDRINSLNPRPMYFSEIRCDPSDDDYLWVLGVSLYLSKDNGESFDGNAGRGTHPDHHAMWVDPNDGRHVILGNDGGVYITYDRGEHWTHLNHMAIGQFYHVTVGPRRNYYVYGGLQDNGSWGGPSRVRSGGGPINEDWISIGGGDGFLCAVDANDPDQIYFESQNGGTGRRNLRTGDQGFIRPRRQRGTRFRFNWRTPFLLSNHNSRIYYSAGNYVFRSFDRGNSLKTISPEITLTDRGSATALGESPFDSDVLFVGTDDGALWMTDNGGHKWRPLLAFDSTDGSDEGAASDESAPDAAAEADPAVEAAPAESNPANDRMMQMIKRMDANNDGKITKDEMPERMARFFDRLDEDGNGVIDEKEIKAAAGRMGSGAAVRDPRRRGGDDDPPRMSSVTQPVATVDLVEAQPEVPAAPEEDLLSGEWEASVQAEGMEVGDDSTGFTMVLKLGADGKVTGSLESQFNSGDIDSGKWDAEKKRLTFSFEGDGMTLDFSGRVRGERMTGTIDINDGMFSMDWEAKRTVVATPTDVAATDEPGEADDATEPSDSEPADEATDVDPDWTTLSQMLPGPRWVSSIEMSKHEEGRVYVTFDGHRSNDDTPYVFMTDDNGKSWKSLRSNLPDEAGTTRCLREDIENPNLLYLGTEFGLWASIDRGSTWTRLHGNLPTVAIHEVAIHPTAGEVVAATHGRSLWVLDVTALRQMQPETVNADAHLYRPNTAIYWRSTPARGGASAWSNRYTGENPDNGAQIFYSIGKEAESVNVVVKDLAGETLREFDGVTSEGLHRVSWDLRAQQSGNRGARQGRFSRGRLARAGTYVVELEVDGETMSEKFEVETDPEFPDYRPWEVEQQELVWELFGADFAEEEEVEGDEEVKVDY